MTYRVLAIPTLAVLFACHSSARAQSTMPAPTPPSGVRVAQAPGATPPKAAKRKRLEGRIRALRVWRLTAALNLDEATATKLFPILHRYDGKFSALMRANAKERRQLRSLMGTSGTDAQINAAINRMIKRQQQMWQLTRQRFAAMRRVLSAKRAAKLLVVLPRIDRQIRQEIRKAMRKHRRNRMRRRRRTGGPYRDPF